VVDSYGLLSVVVDRVSAATELGLRPGTEVTLEGFGDEQEGSGVSTRVQIGAKPHLDTRSDAGPDDQAGEDT